jgi:hypothetical protein
VAEEEVARRQEEKDEKRKQRARVNRMIRSKNKKRVLPVNGTYTKNIVYKEVLTM